MFMIWLLALHLDDSRWFLPQVENKIIRGKTANVAYEYLCFQVSSSLVCVSIRFERVKCFGTKCFQPILCAFVRIVERVFSR